MKAISISKIFLIGILATAVLPACALDTEPVDGTDTEEIQAVEASQDGDPAVPSADAVDVGIASTPTCDGVRNWHGADVPDYTANGTVDCNMVRGCVSEAVRRLQRTINRCYGKELTNRGVALLVTDGDFGGHTESALKLVQWIAGTKVDGQYGPDTRKAMTHPSNDTPNICIRVP